MPHAKGSLPLLVLVASATLAAPVPLNAQARRDAPLPPADSLVVSTGWLAAHLHDPRVVVLHAGAHDEEAFARAHLPGARYLDLMAITANVAGVPTELPAVALLDSVFESVGVSDDSRVVLYGSPTVVGRAFFTLEYLGHSRVSVLDGGLRRWRAEGRAVASEATRHARGRLTPRPRPEIVAGAAWVRDRLGNGRVALLDTRTDAEFLGVGERRGLRSDGHLPGAQHLLWEELLESEDELELRDAGVLRAKFLARGAAPGDTVVTYCLVGMRASLSYLVARWLGYETRMYDGSYAEWSRLGFPLEKGGTPSDGR